MSSETIFWAFAIIGTALFVLRVVLILVGADGGDVYDDVGTPGGLEHLSDILSINTVSAFIMTFGWAGLAGERELGLGTYSATALAFAVGAASMLLTAWMMRAIMRLQTSGGTFAMDDLVGQRSSVYQQIPSGGAGKIQIHAGGILREVSAVSEDGAMIDSFRTVEVVRVVNPETVSVKTVQ